MHRSNLWFGFTQLGMFHPPPVHALVHDSPFRAFGPTNFSLMKIDFREFEGRVPVLTPPSSGQAFSLPFEFSIFFFLDFDTGNRVWKPSRIFIIDLPSMKLLTLNFIIEDNFFLERSISVFCYYCLCKIELFLRLEVSIIRVCIIRVINKSSVRCVILCYLCFAIHTSFCHLPSWW